SLSLTRNTTEICFPSALAKVTFSEFALYLICDCLILLCVYSLSTWPVEDSTNVMLEVKSPSLVDKPNGEFSRMILSLYATEYVGWPFSTDKFTLRAPSGLETVD